MPRVSNENLSLDMIGVYPEHWQEMTLSEACTQVTDGTHDSPKEVESGFPLVTGKAIKNRKIDFSIPYNISKEDHQKVISRSKAERDDILFANIGNSIGDLVRVQSDLEFSIKNVALFKPNQEIINPRFLEYYLFSVQVQSFIKSSTKGSAQPFIGLASLRSFPVAVPPKQEQNYIAKVLGDMDDKIELNRQTNQTLEHIAQAIFKSWFVDFEPTRAKIAAKQIAQARQDSERSAALKAALFADGRWPEAVAAAIAEGDPERAAMAAISGKSLDELDQLDVQGRTNAAGAGSAGAASPEQQEQLLTTAALFPDALVDSELGEIPEGWEVRSFGDVSQCFDSKRIPLSKKKREEKKPGDIPYYGATSVMDYVNEWVFDDIYLLLGEDGSVIKEDGTPFVQYIWDKAWVNNHAHVLQGRSGVSTEQLMIFIKHKNIAAYITGAVQLKLNQGNMNSIPFLDAGEKINDAFYELISPLYERNRKIIESSKTLEELRDTLLPKLLSGELSANPNIKEAV